MSAPDEGPGAREQEPSRLRVLIADDSFLIREGLSRLLELSDAVEVTGTCADEASTVAAVAAAPPDVLLCDIRMPPSFTDEGVRLADGLRLSHPDVGVVLLSQERHVDLAARLLESGASGRGYLLKDRVHDLDLLVSAVRSVARGECHIDSALVEDLVRRRRTEASALDALTPRQRQLLADVAEGQSNAAIARDRFLSVRAVEKHVSEIFGRLGLTGDADISRRVRATLLYLDEHRR
ncbi:response regulator transcription factor [Streptomyces sp. NBC_01298]|uniref:response regulator transcription factor n=1 Tax=Streptomyces sp. NBC_01298 TaxID=2903817 RepID=UPI002E0DD49D|nr:response regulator transcription factor [Streptomyces sp. NBC_01298]